MFLLDDCFKEDTVNYCRSFTLDSLTSLSKRLDSLLFSVVPQQRFVLPCLMMAAAGLSGRTEACAIAADSDPVSAALLLSQTWSAFI